MFWWFPKFINFYKAKKLFCIYLSKQSILEIIYIIAIGTEFSLKLIPRPNILLKMYFDHK